MKSSVNRHMKILLIEKSKPFLKVWKTKHFGMKTEPFKKIRTEKCEDWKLTSGLEKRRKVVVLKFW